MKGILHSFNLVMWERPNLSVHIPFDKSLTYPSLVCVKIRCHILRLCQGNQLDNDKLVCSLFGLGPWGHSHPLPIVLTGSLLGKHLCASMFGCGHAFNLCKVG